MLYADNPLIRPETLHRLLERRRAGDAGLALLAFRPADPGPLRPRDRAATAMSSGSSNGPTPPLRNAPIDLCNAGVLCAERRRHDALADWRCARTTPRANIT